MLKKKINKLSQQAEKARKFDARCRKAREMLESSKALLKELEIKYRTLFESTYDAIMMLDRNGYVDCNVAALKMFGVKRKKELIGKHPGELSPPFQPDGRNSFSAANERVEEAFEKKKTFFEWSYRRLDGVVFPAETLFSRMEIHGKQVLQSTVRDISERRKAEESHRLAQLGELVADMAHEVNNPLMIISCKAQLTMMEGLGIKVVDDNMKIIIDQCERSRDIIYRILTFSKPSVGRFAKAGINDCAEFAVKLMEHQFLNNNVRVNRKYASSLPNVKMDEKQMQEVLFNLLKNAAEAMPGGGTITVATSLTDGRIRLEISDTGSGMSEEAIKNLFVPFYTTKEKGTGLGLSVCGGIIKTHKGEIKFESVIGKGTKAIITLPIN